MHGQWKGQLGRKRRTPSCCGSNWVSLQEGHALNAKPAPDPPLRPHQSSGIPGNTTLFNHHESILEAASCSNWSGSRTSGRAPAASSFHEGGTHPVARDTLLAASCPSLKHGVTGCPFNCLLEKKPLPHPDGARGSWVDSQPNFPNELIPLCVSHWSNPCRPTGMEESPTRAPLLCIDPDLCPRWWPDIAEHLRRGFLRTVAEGLRDLSWLLALAAAQCSKINHAHCRSFHGDLRSPCWSCTTSCK